MRLTRNQSLALAAAVVVVFFAVTLVYLRLRTQPEIPELAAAAPEAPPKVTQPTEATPTKGATPEAGSRFTLGQFERSEVKNGKKIWEVKAAHGEYYPETQTAELQTAQLWVFQDDGSKVRVDSDTATILLDATSLVEAELEKNVVLVYDDDLTIRSEKAIYDRVNATVVAPGPVTIQNKTILINGENLEADLESQSFDLTRNVDSVINSRKE